MKKTEFVNIRKYLERTQKEMAQLLGASMKAVQSFEQGWRNIPVHIERQVYFLLSRKKALKSKTPCWTQTGCLMEQRKNCPAWELKCGDLCWFINGTFCEGEPRKNWQEKMKICRKCEIFSSLIDISD
jgi:DNA-binding XRE family transcriptional regulator